MGQLWYRETFLLYYALLAYSALIVLTLLRWAVRGPQGEPLTGKVAWKAAMGEFHRRYLTPAGGGAVLIVSLALPLFMNAFGSWKSAIPHLHPFTWDSTLADWDRRLHLGHHPWQILQPLLGRPPVTVGLDIIYGLLIPIQVGVVLWQTWSMRFRLREQFFLSYVLIWVLLGTGVAIGLASAGPCFFGRVTGLDDPYHPLMMYLARVDDTQQHLESLRLQHILWSNHVRSLAEPFAGISAMPSLHIAMPTLFTLLGWQTHRRLGWAFFVYLLLNLLGSVHLGWHYAIDGYVSVVGACLIWAASGWWLRRDWREQEAMANNRPQNQRFGEMASSR